MGPVDPAQRQTLGRSAVSVSRLGLGTLALGNFRRPVDDREAGCILDRAVELGVRFIDTAPLYGYGLAERRIGNGLRGRRPEVVISTKVGRLLRPGHAELRYGDEPLFVSDEGLAPAFDFSRDGILRSLEESLERLALDRVDAVFIHDPDDDYETALEQAYPTLHELRAQGVIGAVGVGMNQAEMLARFARESDCDCFLVAGRYSLLDQSALHELLPVCEERGISIVVGGVFNSGILANPTPGSSFDYAPASVEVVARARELAQACGRHAIPLRAAALQFPFGHPAITAVVVGARTVAQLEDNVALMSHPISREFWEELRHMGLLDGEVPVPAS